MWSSWPTTRPVRRRWLITARSEPGYFIGVQRGESMESIAMETLSSMGKRKMYNTTLDADLIRQIKILAAQLEKRQNDLLEEAIKDLLKKYGFRKN
jgi:hypothetical protein